MTTTAPKPPKNKDEEAALEKALAEYKLKRVQAALDFLNSETTQAFRDAITVLMEEGLPVGSAAVGHLQQIPGFLDRAVLGVQGDVDLYNRIITPPEVIVPPTQPMIPAPTATPLPEL